jgi:hypothetical protein
MTLLAQEANRLRAADPDGSLRTVESQGVLSVVGWLVGALLLSVLAREIADLVCRIKRKGMIVDARSDPLRIRKNPDLPGGTVLVIDKDGKSQIFNVCDGKANLTDIIANAAGIG